MPKVKIAEGTKILSIRFPEAIIKKLDRYVKRFQKEFPGISFQRTDAIRLFIERGLKNPIAPDPQPSKSMKPDKPAKPAKSEKAKTKKKIRVRRLAKRK